MILLTGLALLARLLVASKPSTSFYLYNNNEIEFVGPFPEDGFLPLFKKHGEVFVDQNTLRITSGKPNQMGALWSKRQMTERNWQTIFAFRANGERIGGNGLAFWYTKDGHRTGTIFGGPDKFDGLGLFFDTFDEETKTETVPMVVGMLGDGQTSFRSTEEVTAKNNMVIGSCFKSIRNTEAPVYVRVTYFNRHVRVEIDNASEGKNYATCFDAYDVDLPIGNFFGVSASSNFYPDQYEFYALRTAIFTTVSRHADGVALDKMADNEVFKDQSTVARLNEAVQIVKEKQNEMIVDFRAVLGRPANDQLPLNNRMESLERDIRHLDNHLDRVEENLHTMMLLLKKGISEKGKMSANAEIGVSTENPIIANIRNNYIGYLSLLSIQAVLTVVLIMATRGRKVPQRKAL